MFPSINVFSCFIVAKLERHMVNKAKNVNHLAQMLLNKIITLVQEGFVGCKIHQESWLLLGAAAAVSS